VYYSQTACRALHQLFENVCADAELGAQMVSWIGMCS